MPHSIEIMKGSGGIPSVCQKADNSRNLVWKSPVDEKFTVRFDRSFSKVNTAGKYVFHSTEKPKSQEVRIKLRAKTHDAIKNLPKDFRFKYTIEMGGKKWDPYVDPH